MRIFVRILCIFFAFTSAAFSLSPENILVIEVDGSTQGTIEIELLPEVAPLHVARIKRLVREGAYNDVVFHRVISDFMAQTGDVKHGKRKIFMPRYAGTGGSNYGNLKAEFSKIPFTRGIVGMARSASLNSGNSQFFIMLDTESSLNNKYTVFGKIILGQDVVSKVKSGEASSNGAVQNPDYMKNVYIKSDKK